MIQRGRVALGAVTALVLAAGQLGVMSSAGNASAPPGADPAGIGADRLVKDADGSLTLRRDAGGQLTFAGVPAGAEVDNPAVQRTSGTAQAARAHLARYGPAFGTDRPGVSFRAEPAVRAASGQDVVRFGQRVGGLPVLAGELVVSLRADRELGSIAGSLSQARPVPQARVDAAGAAATARRLVARSVGVKGGQVELTDQGRWLFDPQVIGASSRLGARGVWRFEARSGDAVRRLVLVDDRSGGVLMHLDLIQHIDRVVCDNANTPSTVDPCDSGFARTEASGPSAVADVNQAFDYSGAVSDFYQAIGGLDLTDMLGIDVGGVKKLASTVRFCTLTSSCPYQNAFWNGLQMYYGEGFAAADDVVGHEITHGVIDQYSRLFYWSQSGAINESIADIMGEIVDHRNLGPGDSPTNWALGEDLPGFPSGIRNLADPTLFGDPDTTQSANYVPATDYSDGGGVHSNSGVSNKTAYLISQGGTFNGQSITGIDGGDDTLNKTGILFLNVLQSLPAGGDFMNLGDALDQGCQDLIGTSGFTAANCTNVHKAGLATELWTTPANAAQPADAEVACPGTGIERVLFHSETGDPSAKFVADSTWSRNSPAWGHNATSGIDSWFSTDPPFLGTSSLVTADPIALPAGQESFLFFENWRLLDWETGANYDAGTVEVDDLGDADPPLDVASLPWVNGPGDLINSSFGNPAGGRMGFGNDSLGWVASRVDLTSFAGSSVKPQFSMNTDSSVEYIGWFVDDVTVYTCDAAVVVGKKPKIKGKAKVGKRLRAVPGAWQPADVTFTYRWYRNNKAIKGAKATKRVYTVVRKDKGKRMRVRVTGTKPGYAPDTRWSARTKRVRR